MAEISSHEMSINVEQRAQLIANAMRDQIGETAVFAGDYTIVPIQGGIVVSKIFEGDGRSQFADVRVDRGLVEGKKVRPSGWIQRDMLSTRTSTRYLLGAAQAAGLGIEIPEEHHMQIL